MAKRKVLKGHSPIISPDTNC